MLTGIVRFWARRINFDESRIEEVPSGLRDYVLEYMKTHND